MGSICCGWQDDVLYNVCHIRSVYCIPILCTCCFISMPFVKKAGHTPHMQHLKPKMRRRRRHVYLMPERWDMLMNGTRYASLPASPYVLSSTCALLLIPSEVLANAVQKHHINSFRIRISCYYSYCRICCIIQNACIWYATYFAILNGKLHAFDCADIMPEDILLKKCQSVCCC